MRQAFLKETFRSIRGSLGRFLAIMGIAALGCGFFAGLKLCGPEMRRAGDLLYDGCGLYDLRVVSSQGWDSADVDRISAAKGVDAAMPSRTADVVARVGRQQVAVRVSSLDVDAAEASTLASDYEVDSDDPFYLNRPKLLSGRWPQAAGECVISADPTDPSPEGEHLELLYGTRDLDQTFSVTELEVVGVIASPVYPYTGSYGSTTLGSGMIDRYVSVTPQTFAEDFPYTEVYLTVEGAVDLQSGSDEYEALVTKSKKRLQAMADDLAQARLADIKAKAQEQIDAAQAELDDKSADARQKLDVAQAKLDMAAEQIESSQTELADGAAAQAQGEAQLDQGRAQAESQLAAAQAQIDSGRAQLADKGAQLDAAQGQLDREAASQLATYGVSVDSAAEAQTALRLAIGALDQGRQGLADLKTQIDAARAEGKTDDELADQLEELREQAAALLEPYGIEILDGESALAKLDALREDLDSALQQLESAQSQIDDGRKQLAQAQATLDAAQDSLDDQSVSAEIRLSVAQAKLDVAKQTLDSGRSRLESAQSSYEDGARQLEDSRADAERQLDEAQAKIDEAQREVDDLEAPQVYVLDRTQNEGVATYEADTRRMDSIAAVFPLVFFLVAALVSLTTMTRMVEDDRVLIGTFKALGYSTARIASKYLLYAAMASVSGAVLGIVLLSQVLPRIVTFAYSIIYVVPLEPLPLPIDLGIALASGGIGVGVTLVATWVAVVSSLTSTPAVLMLPRVPKAGKRILLERLGPLWRRLSFSWKVTCRNLFRYKRRLLMTVVGIAGCTALLLTGFGLHDSIWDIIDRQYGPIVHYNTTVSLDDSATSADVEAVAAYLGQEGATGTVRVQGENLQAGSSLHAPLRVSVVVPMNAGDFSQAITFRDRLSQDPVAFDEDSVVLTEKTARLLGVQVGNTFRLYDQDDVGNAVGEGHELTVTGIVENYVGNVVYVGREAWAAVDSQEPVFQTLYTNVGSSEEEREALSSALASRDHVSTVVFTDETINMYRNALSAVNMVVVVLIVSAAALAFIVLYNLTNINVSERIREIASLKVLGFTRREVHAYIFREMVLLAVMGDALGLLLGTWLETFVVTTAEVDYVMFGRLIHAPSYGYSFALTLVFTVLVLLFMRPKLDHVDMVESLKSVD